MKPKIFIDCTHTYNSGLNTGIQRVVKNIFYNKEKVSMDLQIKIIPVIYEKNKYVTFKDFPNINDTATNKKNKIQTNLKTIYKLFRKNLHFIPWIQKLFYSPKVNLFLNNIVENLLSLNASKKEKINFKGGDILFLIDAIWLNNNFKYYKHLKQKEVIIASIVYDIIPIRYKMFSSLDMTLTLENWYRQTNGIIDYYLAISDTVKNDVFNYIKCNLNATIEYDRFDYFYLGADFQSKKYNEDIIEKKYKNLFKNKKCFITVSTIEPRKNHSFILDAFEILWEKDIDVSFVIIGKIGWLIEDFIKRVKSHKEYNKKLFMFTSIDDNHLLYAYSKAEAMIFASYTEGFGLPIVESLHHSLPVLASDTEIHKEIGRGNITYFSLNDTNDLTEKILKESYKKADFAKEWINWYESTTMLFTKLLELKNKNFNQKKILMLLTRAPYPTAGGRESMLAQVISFLEKEYKISILIFTKESIDLSLYKNKRVKKLFFPTILEIFKNFLIMKKSSLQEILFYSKKSKNIIEKEINNFKPDIIYADMIRTAQYVEKTKIKKVVDIEDLLSLRYQRFLQNKETFILGTFSHLLPLFLKNILEKYFKNIILKYEIKLISKREKEIVKHFDASFLVSEQEVNYLKKTTNSNTIYVNNQAIPIRNNIYTNPPENNLLFIGNMCTAQNLSSLKMIVTEILPNITIHYKLFIIGNYDEKSLQLIKNNTKIELLGFVENIEDVLKNIKLAFMPISFGTGIKTKILDCMSFGIPVLTNDVGTESLFVKNMVDVITINDFSDINNKLQNLLANKELLANLSKHGHEYIVQKHNFAHLQKQFLNNINLAYLNK